MTRTRNGPLKEILNVRLDEPLAKEIRRIAAVHGDTESEVARVLLHFGAFVERQLEAQQLEHHYAYEERRQGYVDIRARFVPETDDEPGKA